MLKIVSAKLYKLAIKGILPPPQSNSSPITSRSNAHSKPHANVSTEGAILTVCARHRT
jgi:hypothetical protein